jgi:hypothetical protein
MKQSLQVSAKKLGVVAMSNFCSRCFWMFLQLRGKIPGHMFPGIFALIDSFTKNAMHSFFDKHGRPPKCLAELGEIVAYIETCRTIGDIKSRSK